ncbi:type II toxin-antitoxin system Phd/YefM family antitoxin [Testudinibacter aquarius]|uniref:Antitoxin n=1 Tax=Testudinibacter aquarius TaxID=1524974 RepID=A0A4R3XY47_9PAST|nr:type II toxin-antitoxin system Phd/YefM family antitoxin [Testudinibacter aquarius]TNG95739.1 type II toxin-antitoxin system Phd/YefM family antitoxin [Pasteurellaceae bacterium UScroc12]TNG97508.1 type II toxin-antitoxin system Phd/YefM family antitoxin [Pasteurellaceae bacterium USgator41]TNG99410.1 type II toxin-antitoxin system Phd/YefM family antitoxin [Pasteurellaceae bacterium UScroc31]TNH00481.1 type II toxin-antitoxin system Phd/YefM family antitoxin [Pasteurellaceae bacterium USgat
MEAITANQAKVHFGSVLLKVQDQAVQINKNGKPVAVMMSMADYETMEALKLHFLQQRVQQAKNEITNGQLTDGNDFFTALENGQYDG